MVAIALFWATAAGAQAPTATQVKAVFLYRFLEFVQWPEQSSGGATDPIVVGVIRAPDMLSELQHLLPGRTAQNRPVIARAIRDERDLTGLHAVYISGAAPLQLANLLNAAAALSILTVTETPAALDSGAVINFVEADSRIQFEISLNAAHKANLTLSSRLLTIAVRVRKGELNSLFPYAAAPSVLPSFARRDRRQGRLNSLS